MKVVKRCLFVGRFQPFHNGHLKIVTALLKKYDEVIIMIGSAESASTIQNPFTAGERIEMIRRVFCTKAAGSSKLIIVPVRDVDNHNIWVSHVLSYVPVFQSVYSANELVRALFAKAGYKVNVPNYFNRKNNEGSRIRKLMAYRYPEWKKSVPGAVAAFIQSINGEGRLRCLLFSDDGH